MKNLILIIATVLSFSTASFASNIGDGTLAIVKTATVTMTLENESQKEFILSSVFEAENDNIAMVFESDVTNNTARSREHLIYVYYIQWFH